MEVMVVPLPLPSLSGRGLSQVVSGDADSPFLSFRYSGSTRITPSVSRREGKSQTDASPPGPGPGPGPALTCDPAAGLNFTDHS